MSDKENIQLLDIAEIKNFSYSDPQGVAVIMPCIDLEMGRKTANILACRAGMPCKILVVNDSLRQGFIKTLNQTAARISVKYIVYLAQDAYPGRDWLICAYDALENSGKGILAFNDGKWKGRIASFGMVRCSWVKTIYKDEILYSGYVSHGADNELTVIARVQDMHVYNPECTVVEYDPKKDFGGSNPTDDNLFQDRFNTGFNGIVPLSELKNLAKEYKVKWNPKEIEDKGISIVFATQSGADKLDRCLFSFFRTNTYTPVEWIILDKSFIEQNKQVVAKYSTKSFIRHINSRDGLSSSSNHQLLKKSRYPFLLFLNENNYYTLDALPNIIKEFKNSETALIPIYLSNNRNKTNKPAYLIRKDYYENLKMNVKDVVTLNKIIEEILVNNQVKKICYKDIKHYVKEKIFCTQSQKYIKDYILTTDNELKGRIDTIKNYCLLGWLADFNNFNRKLEFEFFIDGEKECSGIANVYREDLKKNGIGDGFHGFELPLPLSCFNNKVHEFKIVPKLNSKLGSWNICRKLNLPKLENDYSTKIRGYNFPDFAYKIIGFPPSPVDNQEPCYGGNPKEYIDLYNDYIRRSQDSLVSIIMPAYNSERTISRAIESILYQKYNNFELIIVDDGSSDDTSNIVNCYVKNYSFIKLFKTENKGASKARALAMRYAIGSYFAYLDSDNEWYPEYLIFMVNILKENPDIDCAYCAQEIYNNNKFEGLRFKYFHRSLLENKNFLDINSFMHTRRIYEQEGGFDENLKRVEDWDLVLRYTNIKFPKALPIGLVKYNKSNHYIDPKRDPRNKTACYNYNKSLSIIKNKLAQDKLNINIFKNLFSKYNMPYGIINYRSKKKLKRFYSIIIPNYETLECLRACVNSILLYTPEYSYEIIIIDNNSSISVKKYLSEISSNRDYIKVVYNKENKGFTYAVNQGISLSKSDSEIVLLNNDAIVTPYWLQALEEAVDDNINAGIIAPRQVLPPSTQTINAHVPFCRSHYEMDVTISIHHANLESIAPISDALGYYELNMAIFFCVLITRECYNKLGFLNYKKGPHFKSDTLYCISARKSGFKIIYTPWAKVYHLVQQATKRLKDNDPKQYKLLVQNNKVNQD